jgi:hypothetical protein
MPEATSSGEPDAGNPHVRFDEGRGAAKVPSYSTGSVDSARYRAATVSQGVPVGLRPTHRDEPPAGEQSANRRRAKGEFNGADAQILSTLSLE